MNYFWGMFFLYILIFNVVAHGIFTKQRGFLSFLSPFATQKTKDVSFFFAEKNIKANLQKE